MYPQRRMVRQTLGLGLLVALGVLALSACGEGGGGSNKPRRVHCPSIPKIYAPANTILRSSSPLYRSVSARGGETNVRSILVKRPLAADAASESPGR
jgi:hypothetical protein